MRVEPGSTLTLDIEKPAAGGRMLARHDGLVVLVDGAIPGERVAARVDKVGKGVAYADTVDVLSASPDRRVAAMDRRCGGSVLAHVRYPRQLGLKGEIIRDAFLRIGRIPLPALPHVSGASEHGYRMRAKLHAKDGRLGFYREGTHQICDAGPTGQLLPQTSAWIAAAEEALTRERLPGLVSVDIAENVPGDERACHLELQPGTDPGPFALLKNGLTGLSAGWVETSAVAELAGTPGVSDVLHPREDDPGCALRLRRGVRAFFQGNRFLLEPLMRHVVSLVRSGPIVDLYAGVGLFGLALAAAGVGKVTLVEGDRIAGADLEGNAGPFRGLVNVERRSVESFLESYAASSGSGASEPGHVEGARATVIVDPPRTGLSRGALAGIVRAEPARLIYVSCDVATLARDARAFLDAGYELQEVAGMDLFPNTAHVETIAVFGAA